MKKLAILFIAFVLGEAVTSCDDFLDVNTDPNNAQSSTATLTLPAAITSAASTFGGYYNILGGLWVQYWTQDNGSNQYKSLDAYDIQQSTLNTEFTETYSGALEDLQYVRNQSKASKDWNLYLMGTVMQCYAFQMMADLYDQIPFDEALLGINNFTPHYRAGQQVYDSLILRIDDALSKDFSAATATKPGNADFLFNGDIDKWIQFANTLKLKIYLRQIYARPDVASAGITALYNAGAEFLTEDAAMTQFVDQENKSNPLYEEDQRKLNTANNIRGSRTFIDFLQANGDPRLDALFIPGSSGQNGLEQGNFGAPTTEVNPTTISRALIKATDPVYFISASESYFLQAEAAARGFGSDDEEALYIAGIQASFDRLALTEQATDFTGPGDAYQYPTGGDLQTERIKAIATQKWVAMAGIEGLESLFERNRTGYPQHTEDEYDDPTYEIGQLVYPIGGVTGRGNFPTRLLFPETERNRNPNTPPQVPATTRVWWDINED